MAIEIIEVAGFKVKKLSDIAFETEKEKENLDFHFEINEDDEVDTFVFDSNLKNDDAFIYSFTESNLTDAVCTAMNYSKH